MLEIEFDHWETCCVGSEFVLAMPFVPRVGDLIDIPAHLFPPHYSQSIFNDIFDPTEDEVVNTQVCIKRVLYLVGENKVQVDFVFK